MPWQTEWLHFVFCLSSHFLPSFTTSHLLPWSKRKEVKHTRTQKERKGRRTREQNHDYFCNFKVSILKKWNNMLLLGLNCDRASSDDCTDISWSLGLNYRLSTHLFNKLEIEEFNSCSHNLHICLTYSSFNNCWWQRGTSSSRPGVMINVGL